jgi:DNA-directed RNA polymerase specialized sigma subunit
MVTVFDDYHAGASDRTFGDLTPDEMDSNRLLALLVQQMEQLPPTDKKILAMYYHEDLKLPEIAACFGLSERQIDEIRTQTVGLLNDYRLSLSSTHLQLGNG